MLEDHLFLLIELVVVCHQLLEQCVDLIGLGFKGGCCLGQQVFHVRISCPRDGFGCVVIGDVAFGREAGVHVDVASLRCSSGAGLEAVLVHHLDEGEEV